MKRIRFLALSMPLVILAVFLALNLNGNMSRGEPISTAWEGPWQQNRIPAWGIVRDSSALKNLTEALGHDIPPVQIEFTKEMLLFLVTGNTEESLEGYVMKSLISEEGGFSVLCLKERNGKSTSPLCQLAIIPRIRGEGLFCFN